MSPGSQAFGPGLNDATAVLGPQPADGSLWDSLSLHDCGSRLLSLQRALASTLPRSLQKDATPLATGLPELRDDKLLFLRPPRLTQETDTSTYFPVLPGPVCLDGIVDRLVV